MNIRGYDVRVERLSNHLGGGVVAYAPALKGCLSDGRTEEEALENLQDAIHSWLETARLKGRRIPPPVTKPRVERRTASKRDEAAPQRIDLGARSETELV